MRRAGRDSRTRMVEKTEIHLKYEGPDVANGTMALNDVIPVLQGISGAYNRLADTENPNVTHRITLADVRPGSADIVLEVIEWLTENAEPIGAAAGLLTSGGVGYAVIKKIVDVIRIKKHVSGDPSRERIEAPNSIVVANVENLEITVGRSAYEAYDRELIDKDLELMTRPLQRGRINSAQLTVQSENEETISELITAEDRPLFELTDLAVTATQETELVVTLNSLTKSTNSGYLYLPTQKRVFYSYTGDDRPKLYSIFGSYNGPVKIRCIAKLDDQLQVISLEILELDRAQLDMFEEGSTPVP